MKAALFILRTQVRALLRRLWLELTNADRPWDYGQVDVNHPTLKLLIEQAEARAELEIGAMVCWSYSRDRVVERRELRLETPLQKGWRLQRARRDKSMTAEIHDLRESKR